MPRYIVNQPNGKLAEFSTIGLIEVNVKINRHEIGDYEAIEKPKQALVSAGFHFEG